MSAYNVPLFRFGKVEVNNKTTELRESGPTLTTLRVDYNTREIPRMITIDVLRYLKGLGGHQLLHNRVAGHSTF